jgi:hypothetical protein
MEGGSPPIVRASWEARLQASYSHQMGGKEEASRERERERDPKDHDQKFLG